MTDEHPTIWMKCPYPDEICVEPMTWEPAEPGNADEVIGVAVCAAGHRWRIVKLPDEEAS